MIVIFYLHGGLLKNRIRRYMRFVVFRVGSDSYDCRSSSRTARSAEAPIVRNASTRSTAASKARRLCQPLGDNIYLAILFRPNVG